MTHVCAEHFGTRTELIDRIKTHLDGAYSYQRQSTKGSRLSKADEFFEKFQTSFDPRPALILHDYIYYIHTIY